MAVDPRLLDYVRRQISAGFRKQQIYDVLLQTGWYRNEVDAAFYLVVREMSAPVQQAAPQPPQARPEVPQSPGFFWKLASSIAHPGRLFEAVRNEKDIGGSLKFYGMVSFAHLMTMMFFVFFIGGIFSNFLDMPVFTYISVVLPIAATIGIISLFFGYFVFLALTFAAAGIVHGFVYLFRGGVGFLQTYKALAYSSGITLLFWPAVLLIYFLPQEFASMILLGGAAVISAALFLAFVKGLSRLHRISLPKALLSVAMPALAAAAVVILFLPSLLALSLFNEDSSGLATGFQGFEVSDWSYDYQGNFYMTFRNSNGNPVTLNTVTADCGVDRSPVVLVTSDPTHLESGAPITYTTGENMCVGKEPGEDYAVPAAIRYLNENNMIAYSSSGVVLGTIPTV